MQWLKTWKIVSDFPDGGYSAFHIHEYCEILYILSGTVCINTPNKSYVLKQGEMMILAPMEYHSVEAVGFPYERIGMHVDCDVLQQKGIGPVLSSVLNYHPEGWIHVFDLKNASGLVEAIKEMHKESKNNFPKGGEMLEVLFHHFLLQLYRIYPQRFKTSAGDELMDSAKKYIETNVGNLPPINKIAGMYYLTTSHFISRFKSHTGYTPKKYYNLCRMAKARCLLLETELPLCDIAEMCNFSDLNGFVRSFRAAMGITPGKFRMLKENEFN